MNLQPQISDKVQSMDFKFVQCFADPSKVARYAQAYDDLEEVMQKGMIAMIAGDDNKSLGDKLVGAKTLVELLQLFKIQDAYNKTTQK